MKKCPHCRAVYGDEMAFCLQDGSALLIAEEEATVVFNNAATDSMPKQGVSPIFAYSTIGLLALLFGGGAVALIMWRYNPSGGQNQNAAVMPNFEQSKTNSTVLQVTPTPIPPLTVEVIQDLMNIWKKSQDTRNFSLYKSCYDTSFRGIKRTVSGSMSSYNYAQWLADRQKMMNKTKYMEVRLENMRISIQDEFATVEFNQFFSVTGYADFGPKIIKTKMTENGAKIIYEELKSSTLVTD